MEEIYAMGNNLNLDEPLREGVKVSYTKDGGRLGIRTIPQK